MGLGGHPTSTDGFILGPSHGTVGRLLTSQALSLPAPAKLELEQNRPATHLLLLVFPQIFHIGKFFLPTYGLLVSTGVLLGLWISVRNSSKQGINPDDAWNLGVLVVLCGIIGAKILYIVNDWSYYSAHPGDIFSWSTMQAGGVFSGGLIGASVAAVWYIRQASHAGAGHLGRVRAGPRFGTRHRSRGMLRRGLLLWQAYESLLGRDLHQPDRESEFLHTAGDTTRADAALRSRGRAGEFFHPDVDLQTQEVRWTGAGGLFHSVRHRTLLSWNSSAMILGAARFSAAS